MNDQWWQDAVGEELDQGDIFPEIPFFETALPICPLTNTNMKHGASGFMRSKTCPAVGGDSQWLARGQLSMAMLLNHGCDLDKQHNKRCTLIRIGSLNVLSDESQAAIITQRSIPMMYLPNVPGRGDLVANLRTTTSIPRQLVDEVKGSRIASMTDFAKVRLGAQLMTYFTRRLAPSVAANSFTTKPEMS